MPKFLQRLAAAAIGFLGSSSLYLAPGLTCGGLAALAAVVWGQDPWLSFIFAFCVPTWPVHFYLLSQRGMARELAKHDRWVERDIINVCQREELRIETLKWYQRSRFRLYDDSLDNALEDPHGIAARLETIRKRIMTALNNRAVEPKDANALLDEWERDSTELFKH